MANEINQDAWENTDKVVESKDFDDNMSISSKRTAQDVLETLDSIIKDGSLKNLLIKIREDKNIV